jgi:molecular chaperone GrpE
MSKKKNKSDDSSNEKIKKKNEELLIETKLEEAENQVLRALADTENLRKRHEREKEDLSNYVISNFAKEVLSILDNIQRALGSVDIDKLKENDDSATKFIEGIELTEKQIITIFEKFKIEKIKSEDSIFDPNIHQAMFEVESEDKEPGIIAEVVQDGYKIGERLLRPALVGVAKKKDK